MAHRRWVAAVTIVALSFLVGCGKDGLLPNPEGAATDVVGTVPATMLPTNIPASTPTVASGGAASDGNPDQFGVPQNLTGHELIASNAGLAPHSGYACVITPAGCACETPILENIQVTFKPGKRMDYHFEGNGYASTWEMTQLGPNQWGFTQNYKMENSDITVTHSVLLTFIENGFIRTDLGRFTDGTIITCPDVTYRRLNMPAAGMTPTP